MAEDFSGILQSHARRWPLMQPQDFAKLAYQSEFGPGHMVDDPAGTLQRLLQEWRGLAALPPCPPEAIGGGLCRFHLTGEYDPALAAPLVARLFARTAAETAGTFRGLNRRLELLEGLQLPGMGPWLKGYRAAGCPAVHHSDQFRSAYAPHYRVLGRSCARFFPALAAVQALAQAGAPAVVAVDGRCGSGKSGLADLLGQLFDCSVFHMDDFYLPPEQRLPDWQQQPAGNMDLRRFLAEVLLPACRGEAVRCRPYNCQSGAFGPERLALPHRLTVVEGSYSLHPLLAPHYSLRLFLTCAPAEQARRLRRREGGYYDRFEKVWIPLEERYLRACSPADGAMTIDTTTFFDD